MNDRWMRVFVFWVVLSFLVEILPIAGRVLGRTRWTQTSAEDAGAVAMETHESPATRGSRIDNGFVFLDGRYLGPPYTINREDLSILVNNNRIQTYKSESGGPPRKNAMRRLNATRREYEQYLEDNDCYFFFRRGGQIRLETYVTAYTLPRVVKMLRSRIPADEKAKQLRQRNWHLALEPAALETLITRFSAPQEFDKRLKDLAERLLRVDEFGINQGNPVETGFVFFDGRYLDTPYVVTRKGLAVFINQTMVEEPVRWPPPVADPSIGEVDPELPAAIDESTSRYNALLTTYIGKKIAYIRMHYPHKDALERVAVVYKKLPCVKRAQFDIDPEILVVTWSDGDVEHIRIFRPKRRPIKLDRRSVLERVQALRQQYETRLSKGCCYFFFGEGGQISMPAGSVIEQLPNMLTILRSSKPLDVKFKEIQETALPQVNKETFSKLVTNFSASEQLEKRLNELLKPREKAQRYIR